MDQFFSKPLTRFLKKYRKKQLTDKYIIDFKSLELLKENSEDKCIFEENQGRPLSPIPAVLTENMPPEFSPTKLETDFSTEDESEINSPERNRFVVNMYESRNFRRCSTKKTSNFKCVERSFATTTDSNRIGIGDIIHIKQSSPIKLEDQPVSLNNLNKTYPPKKHDLDDEITYVSSGVCTADASDLISKVSTIRSSLYQSYTKKLSSESKNQSINAINSDLKSIVFNNEIISKLANEAAIQFEAMRQVTKALAVCRQRKEFAVSPEQIEGERLLLIATHKRQLILDEIRHLTLNNCHELETNKNNSSAETGTVTISDITFPVKNYNVDNLMHRDLNQWFVCILSYGTRVIATKPTLAKRDGNINFTDEVIFTDLPSNFTITLEVYSLLQRQSTRNFSHESKFHINKDTEAPLCPTPKKFLQNTLLHNLSLKNSTNYNTGVCTSSFKICGSLKLNVNDLSNSSSSWELQKIPLNSISDFVNMKLKSCVRIPVKYSGFMTIGKETNGCISWNRYYCVLDGNMLRYWNYPCDEDSCEPVREIDLKNSVSYQKVDLADRKLCARPKTLLLESEQTVKVNVKVIERHLLSADSSSEMRIWQSHFNTVLHSLRTWNVSCL